MNLSVVPETRESYLLHVKAVLGPIRAVVEVGVLRGRYSMQLLLSLRPVELYLVDPWRVLDGTEDYQTSTQADWDARYRQVVRKFRPHRPVRILRTTSVNAAATFPERSVDLVYIDANHATEAVLEDIRTWEPKVRPGGYLSGHDIIPNGNVIRACERYFSPKAELAITSDNPPSWFYRV